MNILALFVNLYPVWIVLASVIGILHLPAVLWFSGRWVEGAIALVMLGMGFTLTLDDFKRLFKIPGSFALGFACQYSVMPLLGWGLGRLLHLEAGFAAGLILVAACPGGVASNLIAYLARANVALSVILTMASTLTAFVMTPLWCKTLAGRLSRSTPGASVSRPCARSSRRCSSVSSATGVSRAPSQKPPSSAR
jgi:BASS family bile acid:Na+ symporter